MKVALFDDGPDHQVDHALSGGDDPAALEVVDEGYLDAGRKLEMGHFVYDLGVKLLYIKCLCYL